MAVRVALVCMVVAVWAAGCCQRPVADVLILNNTETTLEAVLGDQEPVVIEPNTMGLAVAPPGRVPLVLRPEGSDEPVKTFDVELRFEDTGLVTARPGSCAVIANYTEQYGDRSGRVVVDTRIGDTDPGRVMRHNFMLLLGPQDEMPDELNEFATIHRLTEVPCALLDGESAALERHLAHLK
ncbi:MAG: hypothetical protein AAFX99_03885 [Myxococcota bacterium]